MDQVRSARVWAMVSACARQEGAPASLLHVVRACADALGAAGAGLSMTRDSLPREPVLASTAVAEELEEIQFTLGQGPGMDAVAGRGPVLSADLAQADARRRWPAFTPAAEARGIRGVFAFPVVAGAALLGVLDVYRARPGPLTPDQLADGLIFAETALVMLLDARGGVAVGPDGIAGVALSTRRVQVHQAAGMVAAQLGVPVPDALAALRARAYANGQSVADLSAEILARRIRMEPRDQGSSQDFAEAEGPGNGETRDHGGNPSQPGTPPGGRQEEGKK